MSDPTKRDLHPEALSATDRRSIAQTRQSYEQIPYETHAWTTSQPARLETIAKLRGLEAAPADRCRVLEIGCGNGGNLIPLAVAHPRSAFVGVDLAATHIQAAQAAANGLSLPHIEFVAASFVDWAYAGAPFDYVIAHGLMSWITPPLQSRLLEAIAGLLSPRGVAFVSYNTWPGWTMQHAIRQLMRHHNRGITDIEESIERARGLLDVLLQTVPLRETAYREYLESVAGIARDPGKRYYFAHEYLEDENHPFYVRDMLERAAECGLAYLGDADGVDHTLENMPDEPRQLLEKLAESSFERLQILDFAVNRKFRQSLFCRDDVALEPAPDLNRVSGMYVSSSLAPEGDAADPRGDGIMAFGDRHGRTIELDQPVAKAALLRFVEDSPQPIALDDLVAWAWDRLGERPAAGSAQAAADRQLVGLVFGRLFLADMVDVQASPPAWRLDVPARPVASPLARRDAQGPARTTTLRHRMMKLDNDAVCAVLPLLDGTRDRAAIQRALAGRVDAEAIDSILTLAARNALLMPDE